MYLASMTDRHLTELMDVIALLGMFPITALSVILSAIVTGWILKRHRVVNTLKLINLREWNT